MASALVTVTMERVTGLPKDRVVNTWALDQYNPDGGAVDAAIVTAFQSFYGLIPAGQTEAVDNFLSPTISRVGNPRVIRIYDITGHESGTPHGSPVTTIARNMAPPTNGTTPLPDEVAAVLSLEAQGHDTAAVEGPLAGNPPKKTRPRSRYKGKIYFGPLASNALVVDAGFARVSNTFRSVVLAALGTLQDSIAAASPAADLAVWSRVDGQIRPLQAASIDNEFDTQRRRGTAATSRTRVLLDA